MLGIKGKTLKIIDPTLYSLIKPGYLVNEDASAIMLTEMKIDRTRRTMDR